MCGAPGVAGASPKSGKPGVDGAPAKCCRPTAMDNPPGIDNPSTMPPRCCTPSGVDGAVNPPGVSGALPAGHSVDNFSPNREL